MKKLIQKLKVVFLAATLIAIHSNANAQCNPPKINSFTPITGFIGSTVTISGANFDATPANNQVFFGATEATVLSSAFGTMTVTVPTGATTALISVKNNCHKTAYSKVPFNGIFCPTPLTTSTYNNVATTVVAYDNGRGGSYNMHCYDMDLDGKPDVISADRLYGGFLIAKNNSTPGSLSFSEFYLNGVGPRQQAIADFDGDGRLDIVFTNYENGIYSFRNLSAPGSLKFTSQAHNYSRYGFYQIAAGDFNNDGKIDIVAGNGRDNYMWYFRNTSTGVGNISFTYSYRVYVGGQCTGIQCADVDGDGLTDVLATQGSRNRAVSIRNRNTGLSNTFVTDNPEYWSSRGTYPYRCQIADFDKDGKIDLTTCNYQGATNTAVFRNTSTVGNISFAAAYTMAAPGGNYRIQVGDVNGDGYPDIVTKSLAVNVFSVYRNTSTGTGNISFASRIDYTSSSTAEVSGIVIGDLDGDYVPDLATSGERSRTIRFHRNTSSQADNTDPTALCKDITVALSPTGTAVVTASMIDNGSSDACGIGSIKINGSASVTFTCSDIGTNTVTLLVTDNAGNTDNCTATVTVAPAAIIVAGQTTVCQGQTVTMTANAGDSYQWLKDGASISGATSQTYVASTSGDYQVKVTNTLGCSGTSSKTTVVVNNNPTVSVTPSSVAHLCSGSAVLTASTSSLYQWQLNGSNITGATQQSYTATSTGTYKVQVIDIFGCTATSSGIVVTNNPPEIDILGNGNSIANGDATPSAADHTDYGTVGNQVRTYTIANSGSGNLHIDAISLGGSGAGDYSIGGITLPADIAASGSTTFTVTFARATIGSSAASINITNNDCDEGSYSYAIFGELNCTVPDFTSCPTDIAQNTDADECSAVVTYSTTVTGIPTPSVTYTFTGATTGSGSGNGSGSTFATGTTTVKIVATNICGSDICEFDVVVTDNEDPVIDGVNQNLTVTFEGGTSTAPPSYTEQGITFLSLYGTSSHVHLTDRNNDGSTDLWNHSSCCSTPYRLTVGNNVSFTLVKMEVTEITGNATFFVYPTGASVTITSTGTYTFPSGFAGVNEIRWSQPTGRMAVDNVVVSTKTSGSCPADITKVNDTDKCGAIVTYAATASDNCSASISFSPASGSFFSVGTTEVTTTATDAAGNTSTCKFDVTVNDTQDPTITCVGNQAKVADNGVCTYTTSGTEFDPTSFADNCGVETVSNSYNNSSSLSGAAFNLGTTTVVWTATDSSGNTETCSFTVTVTDDQKPTITCVANQAKAADAGVCTYTTSGTEFDPTATGDNCSVASVTNDFNASASLSGAVFNVGTTTVTWTIEDGSGNTETCSYDVVVSDAKKPKANCKNVTVYLDSDGEGSITTSDVNNGSTDNCGIQSYALSKTAFACSDVGTNTVTLTVTDIHSNVSTCTSTITVVDTVSPVISCNSFTMALDSSGNASIDADDVLAPTGCTGTVTLYSGTNYTGNSTTLSVGIHDYPALNAGVGNDRTRSIRVSSGLSVEVWQHYTPYNGSTNNGTHATFTADNPNIGSAGGGVSSAYVVCANPPSNDACGIDTISLDNYDFTCTDVGANTVTLSVTDNNDNTSTCQSTITVIDNIAPTTICKNIIIEVDRDGDGRITASEVDNGSNDACGIDTIYLNKYDFDCSNLGSNTVTLTVVDNNGNSQTCTSTVTVEDNIKPTITCATNLDRNTDAGVCTYTTSGTEFDPTATGDNCSVASVTNDYNSSSSLSGAIFDLGSTTVVWTIVDGSGNTQTCTYDVVVSDNENPVANCQNTTVTLSSGGASITTDDIDDGSTDNCGIASLELDDYSFDCDDIGSNTVTLTVTDNSGNTHSCNATVTVVGVVPTCTVTSSPNTSGTVIGGTSTNAATNQMFLGYGPQSMNISCAASGGSSLTYSWAGSGLSNTSIANPVFTPSAAGNYTLVCTVTNNYGCVTTCSITICVIDVTSSKGSKKKPKVIVCHVPKGNPSNVQNIHISINAVPAHLGLHGGCTLGPCGGSCDDNKSYKRAVEAEMHTIIIGEDHMDLIVYPNPSANSFNFILESPTDDLVHLVVSDLNGRILVDQSGLTPNDEVTFGENLPAGAYFATIQQGDYAKTIKIVKVANN